SARSLMSKGAIWSGSSICGALSRLAVASHASGKAVCREEARDRTKIGSSLSFSSRESQAFGRSIVCNHWVSRVVLPKPAGAHTRVISPSSATFKRSIRRVLVMTSVALRGQKSFVRIKERREPVVDTGSYAGSLDAAGMSEDSVARPMFECLPASLLAAACKLEILTAFEGPK